MLYIPNKYRFKNLFFTIAINKKNKIWEGVYTKLRICWFDFTTENNYANDDKQKKRKAGHFVCCCCCCCCYYKVNLDWHSHNPYLSHIIIKYFLGVLVRFIYIKGKTRVIPRFFFLSFFLSSFLPSSKLKKTLVIIIIIKCMSRKSKIDTKKHKIFEYKNKLSHISRIEHVCISGDGGGGVVFSCKWG